MLGNTRMQATLTVVRTLVAAIAVFTVLPAQAQNWPSKPVRIVSPFAPGGGSDTLGRVVADYLSERMGSQFVVENRGGAGGVIGSAAVAKASPDGYTFVVSSIATHSTSRVEVRVRREWVYDPFPQRARFATLVGNLVRRVRAHDKSLHFRSIAASVCRVNLRP